MDKRKEHRELVRILKGMGWDVTQTTKRHLRCTKPGHRMVIVAVSGDPRARRNAMRDLRAAGRLPC